MLGCPNPFGWPILKQPSMARLYQRAGSRRAASMARLYQGARSRRAAPRIAATDPDNNQVRTPSYGASFAFSSASSLVGAAPVAGRPRGSTAET